MLSSFSPHRATQLLQDFISTWSFGNTPRVLGATSHILQLMETRKCGGQFHLKLFVKEKFETHSFSNEEERFHCGSTNYRYSNKEDIYWGWNTSFRLDPKYERQRPTPNIPVLTNRGFNKQLHKMSSPYTSNLATFLMGLTKAVM